MTTMKHTVIIICSLSAVFLVSCTCPTATPRPTPRLTQEKRVTEWKRGVIVLTDGRSIGPARIRWRPKAREYEYDDGDIHMPIPERQIREIIIQPPQPERATRAKTPDQNK